MSKTNQALGASTTRPVLGRPGCCLRGSTWRRPQALEGYLAELDRRELQGSTRNRKMHTLKTFFKWLVGQELRMTNPAAQLVAPRAIKQEPRYLSEDEYRRLLRACSHHPRDAAIIEVFLQTGMRLSELARLTLTDVELPRRITREIEAMGSVRVQRKGGKIERITLNDKACQALAAYLKVRPTVAHDGLFVTKFRTRMTTRAIAYMVAKYLAETGITGASVHTLRHTMATHHVARGTDLKTVQVTLGHASLATTTIYVSLGIGDLWIIAGQSNAADYGRGPIDDPPWRPPSAQQ